MRRILFLCCAFGLAVVSAGCSSTGDDSTSAGNANSNSNSNSGGNKGGDASDGGCGVVSTDEVMTATGTEVVDSLELPTGCQWHVSANDPSVSYEWQAIPVEGYQSNLDMAQDTSSFDTRPVEGLGDAAFLRLQTSPNGDVLAGETWVKVGDQAYFVRTAGLPGSDEVLAAQRELAGLLVTRVS